MLNGMDHEIGSQAAPDAPSPRDITQLLRRIKEGEKDAADDLIRAIGAELHRIAARYMHKERSNHTLQPTALMNEACLRLLGPGTSEWNDRNHFLAVASRVMRQILVDYARSRNAEKRGGDQVFVDLADAAAGPLQPEVLDVDSALKELALVAPRQAQLVELRFFGGLSLEEAAAVLETSSRTADKDWALARAWLRRRLGPR
jgi:RNA polymerase sigma-70 factor, ECF subfamily